MKDIIGVYAGIFNATLDDYLMRRLDCPSPVKDAVAYAMTGGGKRLRPMLCYLGAEFAGKSCEEVQDFALAVELIHGYSLIHDDLPCMDNDTLRRGKPTTHVKFGEAVALLAGDAMLNSAFEVLLETVNSSRDVLAASYIAKYAGTTGMIGGQCMDVTENNGVGYDENALLSMYSKKTSGLLIAALLSGAVSCGCSKEEEIDLLNFADYMGVAYQITDDILDCTSTEAVLGKNVKSDEKSDKKTYVAMFGMKEAEKKAKDFTMRAVSCISKYGEKADKLIQLCHYLVGRNY